MQETNNRRRLIIKIFSTPVIIYITLLTIIALTNIPLRLNPKGIMFPAMLGFSLGCIFFSFFWKLKVIYIAGHEFAHWIFAKLFRRETNGLEIKASSGGTMIHNPNIWILLAPYFFPTYTVLWLLFMPILYLENIPPIADAIFFFILGVSVAYHTALTVYALSFPQSDLEKYGKYYSIMLIIMMNFIIFYIAIVLINGTPGEIFSKWKGAFDQINLYFNRFGSYNN